jgi:hypothetical protein
MTSGLLVLVQEVMAAMTTAPCGVIEVSPTWSGALALGVRDRGGGVVLRASEAMAVRPVGPLSVPGTSLACP